MSEIHLKNIRRCLAKAHWSVVEELDGDGYRISGIWVIERPDGTSRFHLEFQGLDDMQTLPIEKSYACEVREAPHVSCYFSKPKKGWPKELAKFEKNLIAWGKD